MPWERFPNQGGVPPNYNWYPWYASPTSPATPVLCATCTFKTLKKDLLWGPKHHQTMEFHTGLKPWFRIRRQLRASNSFDNRGSLIIAHYFRTTLWSVCATLTGIQCILLYCTYNNSIIYLINPEWFNLEESYCLQDDMSKGLDYILFFAHFALPRVLIAD